jgi:hypothetical protein
MNRVPILISASLFLLTSCNKDKFATKPSLEIKSINTQIPVQGQLDVIFTYTSKKGDIGNGNFTSIRQRINARPLPPGSSNPDTILTAVPDFPDNQSAELEFRLDWATQLHESPDNEPDSFVFKFALVDRAGISSDTIVSPMVIVFSQ